MAKLARVLTVLSMFSASPALASADSTVRRFFAALESHDFHGALRFTDGSAAGVIATLLGSIDREAARKHAVVELRIAKLELVERAPDASGQIPVEVRYDIDVFGRKWMFRWKAKRLSGTASFYVDGKSPRIVAIVGQFARD